MLSLCGVIVNDEEEWYTFLGKESGIDVSKPYSNPQEDLLPGEVIYIEDLEDDEMCMFETEDNNMEIDDDEDTSSVTFDEANFEELDNDDLKILKQYCGTFYEVIQDTSSELLFYLYFIII